LAAFLAPWLIRDATNLALQPDFSPASQVRVGYVASFIGLIFMLLVWRHRRIYDGFLGGYVVLTVFWIIVQLFMLAFDAFVVMQ
jgi:hypothetical protein